MFGQGGNSSFGNFNTSNQSSPFGQSAFGKPAATTSFGTGTAPVFGNNTSLFSAKPAGTNTGSLFGNTSITPAFGTATTTQSFGGFGNTMTNVPIFGSQQNQGGNLFGASTNTTSAFGQPNKTTFGFGQTSNTSLFGQPQQQAQQSTSFGQPAASGTGLFSSGFGSANTMTNISGTGAVKFSPVTGTDTMIKNGVTTTISTRHHCITCMKEYESKSLEELRLEDYVAGRKGPAQGQAAGIFSQPTQALPFGTAAPISTTSTTGFGAIGTGFGTTNQANSLFSKPIAGFGAPTATTATSAFAFNSPNTNTSLFNAQSKPFGTPAANTSLFGATNPTSTPGSVFGTTGTQNTFGSAFSGTPQNQSIGLFNQNKPAFNTPASTSTSFGFGQTPAANTGNLFGGKPAATGFGTSTFGTQQTSGFQSGTTGFGTLQNNNTSLFNSSFKPVGQTTGFAFGNTPSSTTAGLGTNTGLTLGTPGTSLFQQTAKPSLFSGSSSNTNFNTTGTFGQTNTFGLGNNNLSTLGSNLFGGGLNNLSNAQQNSTSVPVHQQILALVSAPFGDSPLLKNLLPASGKTDQLLKPTTNNNGNKTLNSSLYKVLPNSNSPKIKPKVITSASLSKKSIFEGLEDEDPLLEAFQPRPNAKRLVLRPKVNNSVSEINKSFSNERQTNNNSLIEEKNYAAQETSEKPQELVNKENTNEGTSRIASNDRRSSNSWLISSLPRKTKEQTDEELGNQNTPFCTSDIPEEFENTIAELRSQNDVQQNQHKNDESLKNSSNVEADKSNADISILGGRSSELDDSSASLSTEQIPNKANVKLVRSSYYTIPPIDKLDDYVVGNTCIVPHFTIGRKGYGNVFYSESFDIYGLNLDEIVHFRSKEVIIYPDDNIKPPVGQGLNRKAQVTLDRVWPLDKSTHEPVTDPQRLMEMDYEGKLRRVSAKHDTRFLDYRPETGSWVFKVDHFSKYGLSDSDDDDADVTENATNKLNQLKKLPASNNLTNDLSTLSTELKQYASYNFDLNNFSNNSTFDKDEIMPFSPTSMQASILGTDSHKLQLMKASFFDPPLADPSYFNISNKQHSFLNNLSISELDESLLKIDEKLRKQTINKKKQSFMDAAERKEIEKLLDYVDEPSNLRKRHKSLKESMKVLPPPVVRPEVSVLKYNLDVLPYGMSIVNSIRSKCIADLNIHRGRIFRASWGPNLTLISLCTRQDAEKNQLISGLDQLDSYIGGRQENDMSSGCIVQRLKIFGGKSVETDSIEFFCESIEAHLNAQLDSCEINLNKICPFISKPSKMSSITLLHAHKEIAQKLASFSEVDALSSYFRDVWKLCECLWGNLEEISNDEDENPYKTVVVRKQALSEWFKSVTTNTVFEEMAGLEDDDEIIFSLVTGHKLEEACEKLRKNGDYSLALLISQLGGSLTVRELIKQQIQLWEETNTIDHISISKFKMFMLIAAVPLIQNKDDVINICESLDWKRAFALHLWYLNSSVYSLADILDQYESAFQSEDYAYTFKPYPEYFKDEFEAECCGRPLYDLCYQLLKLYCVGTYSLEAVVNPQNHTYDPLDYRLSWFLMQVLRGLGYSHLSEKAITLTHESFASQLESYNLWHWSIFVILHLENAEKRCKGVKDLLLRNVQIDKSKNYLQREEFLINKLQIPTTWINYSKAVRACALKRYGEAAWYFAHAEEWNKSHEIIMNHIAADAIINEEYKYIKELLNLLSPSNNSTAISGWSYQGQLILDYMKVTEEIQLLLASKDYTNIRNKLYSLESELTLMCSKINLFPCITEKHILCQAEIAKRTFQLAKSLLMLHSNNGQETNNFQTSNILSSLIKDLPLPEDYAQQELRPIINMCVEEIIKQK